MISATGVGRGWLVESGDTLPGVGKILSINPRSKTVITEAGVIGP